MAIGDSYAGVGDLALRLGSDDSFTYPGLLDTASRAVEQFCHRQFNKETAATARTFCPVDADLTIVDDFHTITGLVVKVDKDKDGVFEATWTTADYMLAPANGVVSGSTGWPFWQVWARVGRCFPEEWFGNTVQVTAQWGWTAVPAGIKEATLAVAEDMYGKSPGKTRSFAIDGYSASFVVDADGEMLGPFAAAAPYRRFEGFA